MNVRNSWRRTQHERSGAGEDGDAAQRDCAAEPVGREVDEAQGFADRRTQMDTGAEVSDEEATIKYVRKRLYVTDKAPALSVDLDGFVRCGLSSAMSDSDMLVLGLVLSMKNAEWKSKLIDRVKAKMEGASTEVSRVTRAFEMLKDK
jgi:hypothetical protein